MSKSRRRNLVGERFHYLTVVSFECRKPCGKNQEATWWRCLCDCGKECVVRHSHLITGGTKSCGCLRSESKIGYDIIGTKQGRLTVKSFAYKINKATYWECECDCGEIRIYSKGSLSAGTQSCGCLMKENQIKVAALRKGTGEYSSPKLTVARSMFIAYRSNSLKLGRAWGISWEEFLEYVSAPCYYCGIVGHERKIRDKVATLNGIDRLDNAKGYIPGNMVPCCKICNRNKGPMSEEVFTDWVLKVSVRHRPDVPLEPIFFKMLRLRSNGNLKPSLEECKEYEEVYNKLVGLRDAYLN